jgi:DNA-binding SARP family transcriptional activator
MNQLKLLICIFIFFLLAKMDFARGQEAAGGLRFYSQDQEFAKRTSFTLFDGFKAVDDSFSLQFDFRIYDSERFGYIFRIIEESTAESETPLCHFLCHPEFSEGHNTLFFIQNNKKSGKILITKNDKKWIPFSLKVNCRNKTARVACNDSVFTFPIDLPQKLNVNVVFGLLLRNNAEVAAFDIRNVRFKSNKKEYIWPLNEVRDNVAHEIKNGEESEVKNPSWLITQHFHWSKVYQCRSDVMAGINFNEKTQDIMLVNKDSMLLFNVLSNQARVVRYHGQRPFDRNVHFSIINPKTDELISYDFHFLMAKGEKAWSVYEPDKQSWTAPEPLSDQEENHLHVMFWNNDITRLIRFGGYAHYKYFNDFRSYDFATRTWEPLQLKGDEIYPRSGGAIGKNPENQQYYLYGGLGNKDGEQVLGVQNFYDLFRLDFNNRTSKKIWELEDKSLVFVPRSQMVVEPSDNSFYLLCNQSDKQDAPLCLYKFSLYQPIYEVVSDSLPSNFYTISDNAFLFKNNRLGELYAVVRSTPGEKTQSQVSIYKLNFPPVKLETVDSANKGKHPFLWIIIPLTLVLILVLVTLFFVLKKARKREQKEKEIIREELAREAEIKPEINEPVITSPALAEKDIEGITIAEPVIGFIRPRVNAVWLMGKFAIFDKKGVNITHLCSSKIKSLFFLIFLSTIFDEGISSDELSEVLWPGMDKTRSKNNRSVTMNHLRKIFEDMEGISLVHDKRNWKINFEEPIYIDLVNLYNKRSDKQSNGMSIIGLYSLGNLLQDEKIPELDKFKGAFETEALELLNAYGQEFFDRQQYGMCSEIAAIIHNNFDELNENALELKLKALTRLRNYNKARQEYDQFCQRFKLLMDIDFTVPFNKLAGID